MFNFIDSITHPGYYIIKNDYGNCLSIKGNKNEDGAEIWAEDCKPEAGQNWKWLEVIKIPSAPKAKLINGLGKCASVDPNKEMNTVGIRMHQIDCNTTNNEAMLWSWNETSMGSRDRHICNGMGQCAASGSNEYRNNHLITWDYYDEHGQRFSLVESKTFPGFYTIKNDHGKCLSVPENKDRDGAEIWVSDCNHSEAGQLWKWLI